MVIETPTANVEVVGTEFRVDADKNQTILVVESGAVKLQRRSDGSTIEVPRGKEAVASLDTKTELASRPLPAAPPSSFSQSFDNKPAAETWRGEWLPPDANNPGRLRCVTDLSYRRADDTPVAAYTVNMRSRREPVATVSSASVLRLKFKTSGPFPVLALVGLFHGNGSFAGNFQTMIKPGDGTKVDGGWRRVETPLSSWKGVTGNPTIPEGARVRLLFLAAYSPKANLELAEVSITPADRGGR
jgi:hypothetical protein